MNPDGRDGQVPYAPVSRKWGAWVGAIGLIMLLYFMSPMFVARAFGNRSALWTNKSLVVLYAPAEALYNYWNPYRKLLEAEAKWLGL